MEIMKTPEEKPEHLRDKKPEMKIRRKLNIQAKGKYLLGLNGRSRQDKEEIEQRLITREQRQEMMIPVRDQSGDWKGRYHGERDSAYIMPASKKNDELITVSLNRESSKDHQFQETHRTRRSEILFLQLCHI